MLINAIEIEGAGTEVRIARTQMGAVVTAAGQEVCVVGRREDREARFAKALRAAEAVYGRYRGRPNATNSMVLDVLDAIDRVAGC